MPLLLHDLSNLHIKRTKIISRIQGALDLVCFFFFSFSLDSSTDNILQDERLMMDTTYTKRMSYIYPILEEVCCALDLFISKIHPTGRHTAMSF